MKPPLAMLRAQAEHRRAKAVVHAAETSERGHERFLAGLRILADRYRQRAAAPTCIEDVLHRAALRQLAENVDDMIDETQPTKHRINNPEV